jgi:hypothetical protein
MRRTAVTLTLCVALLLLTRAWTFAPIDTKDTKKAETAKGDDVPAAALSKRVDMPGFDDARTTAHEALEFLTKNYGVSFDIDLKAFDAEGLRDVEGVLIADPKPIREIKNARLDHILSRVLAKIPSPSGATYLVRRDVIEITTTAAARAEVWGEGYDGPFLPLVNAHFQKVPLDEALARLADQAQFNVLIDKRVGDKATTAVGGRFRNLPLDTAVTLLAEMAELKVVHRDNALFVTTPDAAANLVKQFRAEVPKAVSISGPGFGIGACISTASPSHWRKGSGHPGGQRLKADAGAGM